MFFTPRSRRTKAFTMLELIVVIVILGILALLAIPTFSKVIAKSQDSTTVTMLQAVARDAQALRALDDASWDVSVNGQPASAIGETAARSASAGVFAAPSTAQQDNGSDPSDYATITYKVDGEGVAFAAKSKSGKICIVGASFTSVSAGSCVVASAAGGVSTMGNALNSSSSPLPSGTQTAAKPNAPTNVTAVAGNASAVVSFTPGASVVGAPVSSYRVYANGLTGVAGSGAGPSVTVTGLTNGTSYTFTVVALSSSNGSVSTASAPSAAVTPVMPALVYALGNNDAVASSSYVPDATYNKHGQTFTLGAADANKTVRNMELLTSRVVGSTTVEVAFYYGSSSTSTLLSKSTVTVERPTTGQYYVNVPLTPFTSREGGSYMVVTYKSGAGFDVPVQNAASTAYFFRMDADTPSHPDMAFNLYN